MSDGPTEAHPGIWVRLLIEGGIEVTGFVSAVESPQDFWSIFHTPLVSVERAVETPPSGKKIGHDLIHVNRDRILLASEIPGEP